MANLIKRIATDDGEAQIDYNALANLPTIPSKTSQLTNDSDFATNASVDTKVAAIVESAPETLNTLNELAAALGDDPNFATTVATELGKKADKADLASVATSGNYNDLSNKPTIPDQLSDLTSDAAHRTVTDTEKATWNAKSNFSGNYNDLTNKPTIPTVPSSLPANGGNADTVDGKHAGDFATASEFTSHINNKSNPHGVTAAQVGAVEKTIYEYNRQLDIGQYGRVCIGKFPMYDSNITVEINSTTDRTYHGTLVVASQNINTSLGGVYTATVYGDANNSLTDSIKIEYLNGSNIFSVYVDLPAWSKNFLHIQFISSRGEPTDIATVVDEIPSTATIVPTNALKVKFDSLSSEIANLKTFESWTFTLEDGTTMTKAVCVGAISTENWTFTLEDGSTVTKGVYVG